MPKKSRLGHCSTLSLLAGGILTVAQPAWAQTDPSDAGPASGGADDSAVRNLGPAPFSDDATSIGGPPLNDASPRLPRVDYGRILEPTASRPGDLRGQAVLQRSRPDYDPIGFRTGSFRIFPEVSARVGYDSNAFSQSNGRSDIFGAVRGAATAQSIWGRHAVGLEGFVDKRVYGKFGSNDAFTYNGRAFGRLDVGVASSLSAGVQRSRVLIARGATTEVIQTLEPVRYDLTSANIGGHTERGRFAFDAKALVSKFDYKNSLSPARVPISQQFRDFTLYQGNFEVGYDSGAGPIAFASVQADVRRYRIDGVPIVRDSEGIEILGGLRGDITPLLRGRVGVGYLHYNFKDPTIKTRSGLAVDARLDYLASELTTLSLRARRNLKNVSSVTAPGALAIEVGVGVDHELLRNLIVSASANYEVANYAASPLRVKTYGANTGAQYLLNRHFRLDANLGYNKRDESGSLRQLDFDEINVSFGVTYRF